MTRLKTALAAAALAAPALVTAAPATAQVASHASAWLPYAAASQQDTAHHRRDRHHSHNYDYGRGYYDEPVYRDTRVWQGRDGRYYCRKKDGTTGLVIGAAAGALLGREVAGRGGDRTLGAILGAAGGALLGREIDRGGSRCR
jgi:uncharacterized protein YcfJ